MVAAGVITALIGALVGFLSGRLRGPCVAFATLGVGEIVLLVIGQWDSRTPGPVGLSGALLPDLKGLIVSDDKADGTYAQNTSTIAVFAKNQAALDAIRALDGAQDFHAGRLSPWTDDASDILGPFLSQWRRS